MKSLGGIEVISTDFESSAWEQNLSSLLWRSPSSPPYSEPQSRSPFASPKQRASADQSSPSTPSEFEFVSLATPEVRDEPPASPKFVTSFATGYWAAASSRESGVRTQISSFRLDAVPSSHSFAVPSLRSDAAPSSIDRSHDDPTIATGYPLSHPARKQSSIPRLPSPSVRQLITEEMRAGEHDEEWDLHFYSAPQTPAPRSWPLTPTHRPLSPDYEQLVASSMVQRKSKSTVIDRQDIVLYPERLTPSKSEPHAHSIASPSLSAWYLKGEEEKPAKKPATSKSFKKWPFKDFLRRTVPSSKTDAHFMTRSLEATSSSRSFLSNPRSTPISPQASPSRSHIDCKSLPSTLQAIHPTSHAPHHPPPSTRGRSRALSFDTHSKVYTSQYPSTAAGRASAQYPSTPGRTLSQTPAPSPPRSPLSPHLAHYKLQKAQSQDLGRKTFLPYRQSLLGCLGGSGAFSSDQLVW